MAFTSNNIAQQPRNQQDNQYDLQRQKIREEEQKRQKLEQEALQRRLASRGFTAGSGYTESQQRKMEMEGRAGERSRLRDIDIAQLGAQETRDEAQRQREWMTGERVGSERFQGRQGAVTRAWQTGENEETRRLQERRLTNEERQQAWAQGMTEDQFAEQKLQNLRGFEIAQTGVGQRQQEIDNAARNFRDRLSFDRWATEQGYSEAEKERAWRSREAQVGREYATEERLGAQGFQLQLTNLQDTLTRGVMELQDTLETNRATLKNRLDYLFMLGQNGESSPPGLSEEEITAYEMGRTGQSIEERDRFINDQLMMRNQLILTLAESPELKDDIVDTWDQFQALLNPEGEYEAPELNIPSDENRIVPEYIRRITGTSDYNEAMRILRGTGLEKILEQGS